MAHSFHPIYGALEIDVCQLYGNFAVGATGAVGTLTAKGVTSVTRNSAGNYTILLDDNYNAVLWADAIILDATTSDPTTVGVACKLVSADAQAAGGGMVVIQFYSTATPGTVEDPRSGAVVYFKVDVRRSSVT